MKALFGGLSHSTAPDIFAHRWPEASWRGGRAVECGGLENRFARKGNGGSNPSLSANAAREEGDATTLEDAELAPSIFRGCGIKGRIAAAALKPPSKGKRASRDPSCFVGIYGLRSRSSLQARP